jgi:flavorubredoxin
MNMIKMHIWIGAAALLASVLAQPVMAEEWLLLSREGECTTLDVLQRKLPKMPPLHTPDTLETYLKKDHFAYSRKVHSGELGVLIEFQVPAAGLSVVLVPRQYCREILPGPR